jgi:exodeoxyribonuclease VII small subunit
MAKLVQSLLGKREMVQGMGNNLAVDREADRTERWNDALLRGSFEDVFQALGEAVECLESGNLPLEEAVQCYEFGARLADRCGKILSEAELRVSQLDAELLQTAVASFATEDELR